MTEDGDLPANSATAGISRRIVLGSLGLGVLGGAAAGGAIFAVESGAGSPDVPALGKAARMTVADWAATRGRHYYIAHRGSGDVFPEHTMDAYQAALQWGAKCFEVSVGRTSDGVLICLHDATYDRTTTAVGKVSDLSSTVLRAVGVRQPRLGPAWIKEPLPSVPLLEDVLSVFGGHAILCLDPKDSRAYPAMLDMVERHGLQDSVIFKFFHQSPWIAQAKRSGYPVFVYVGVPAEVAPKKLAAITSQLEAARDYLVIPAFDGGPYLDDETVQRCVATGVPVWTYPLHRRVDVDHFFGLGVAGAICSSYGYITRREPTATADSWRYKAISSGEMTRIPSSDGYALSWTGKDELSLTLQGHQHFVTLGQFAPLRNAKASYVIEFEGRWSAMPTDRGSNLTLAFAHTDDAYYEHRIGTTAGYHAIMRPDGRLELFRHDAGAPNGRRLAGAQTPPATQGAWMKFRLAVTPGKITWSRLDAGRADVVSMDSSMHGGYLHLGRSASDGVLSVRTFAVS